MRIAHLGDLHLGRKINDYPIIELQRFILSQIADKIEKKEIETVIIAGDVYDSPVPDAEAVSALSDFLTRLRRANKDVFMIAGNHDRGDYIEYGSELFREMDIHVCGIWKGKMECIDLLDRFGPLHMYCLPYISPDIVNRYIESDKQKVKTYTEAVRWAISTADINWNERNILVAHQFVKGAVVHVNGSEDYLSFGKEEVSPLVFDGFDYVALGHIHKPQSIRRETVRYCGAPLKFAQTEVEDDKSFTFLTIGNKGEYRISLVSLTPSQEFERLQGSFSKIVNPVYAAAHKNNFVHIVLEEKHDIPDAITSLREVYPYIVSVSYADGRVQANHIILSGEDFQVKKDIQEEPDKEPGEIFREFFLKQNNRPLSMIQEQYMDELIAGIFGGKAK